MSKTQKKRILILLALVVSVAIFVPLLFGSQPRKNPRSGEDSWRTFVYEFQTLITGILAIGAAFFTIRASQKIDERQQIRHEQIYDLQTRPDKLRLARAYREFLQIDFFAERLFNWGIPIPSDGFAEPPTDAQSELLRIERVCTYILPHLESPKVEAITELFDGDLSTSFLEFETGVRNLREYVMMIKSENGKIVQRVRERGQPTYEMNANLREQAWFNASRTIDALKINHSLFKRQLDQLMREYKVV